MTKGVKQFVFTSKKSFKTSNIFCFRDRKLRFDVSLQD
uniref:Uncharacterized protein n=1 Tax=Anguilla anguilla TaxID=7936 RepID=A0A0E9WAH5_ANGAN